MWRWRRSRVLIFIIATTNSGNNNRSLNENNAEKENSVQFYIKNDGVKIVTIDFTANSVLYNGSQLDTYSIDSYGYTIVVTRSGVKIRYRIGYSDFNFCTFINESKNSRLAAYKTSIRGDELVGSTLQVSDRCLSTKDDDVLASYCGDRNSAVASFVCAYTDLFNTGEYHDYFTSWLLTLFRGN